MKTIDVVLTIIIIVLILMVIWMCRDKLTKTGEVNVTRDIGRNESREKCPVDEVDIKHPKYPKPNMKPTFERESSYISNTPNPNSDHSYRFSTTASRQVPIELPLAFSCIKEWSGMITGVFDQEKCGVCWAVACSGAFTDRIRIKSSGKFLGNGDYISPFALAACIKCGNNNSCPRVCEGNYLDDVLDYLVDHGAVAQSDIDKYSKQEYEYHCFDYAAHNVKPWKGSRKYRVNIFPPGLLTTSSNLRDNERAIMEEIYLHGPVCTIFKVYVPNDYRNFYVHSSGIYGHGWSDEPKQTDGYHAINIVAWGQDVIDGKVVKYWIIRNSWGGSWGSQGFAKILRGENFGMIESDVWAIDPLII